MGCGGRASGKSERQRLTPLPLHLSPPHGECVVPSHGGVPAGFIKKHQLAGHPGWAFAAPIPPGGFDAQPGLHVGARHLLWLNGGCSSLCHKALIQMETFRYSGHRPRSSRGFKSACVPKHWRRARSCFSRRERRQSPGYVLRPKALHAFAIGAKTPASLAGAVPNPYRHFCKLMTWICRSAGVINH